MELSIFGLVGLGVAIAALLLGLSLMFLRSGKNPDGLDPLLNVFLNSGWLLPSCVCALFFGAWLVDIVIPTLKGANFNQLYDLHGIRYLDITLVSFVVGFVWFAFVNIKASLVARFSHTARL